VALSETIMDEPAAPISPVMRLIEGSKIGFAVLCGERADLASVTWVNDQMAAWLGLRAPSAGTSGLPGAWTSALAELAADGSARSALVAPAVGDGALLLEMASHDPGPPSSWLILARDATATPALDGALARLALRDPLTDLPNRRLLDDRLGAAIERARHHGAGPVVLFVDVDHLKAINDRFGHDAGDRVLRAVGERLAASVREGDTVARVGGDEFVVALVDVASHADAAAVARRAAAAVRAPIAIGEAQLVVTAAIGLAIWPADGETAGALIASADRSMYADKRIRMTEPPEALPTGPDGDRG
jgi:diguanylate cyclase (GGDEF)-like protein